MVNRLNQGTIIKASGISFPLLIVSKNTINVLNQGVITCPIVIDEVENALHLRVENEEISGLILCEHLRLIDLSERSYSVISELPLSEIINVTDAIQSIFDYI